MSATTGLSTKRSPARGLGYLAAVRSHRSADPPREDARYRAGESPTASWTSVLLDMPVPTLLSDPHTFA